MAENTIKNHIEKDKKIIDDPLVSSQSRRHFESELKQLERYQENHPDDQHDPTPLELYCDENPEANECKIFDL
jgi:hypothetical protein